MSHIESHRKHHVEMDLRRSLISRRHAAGEELNRVGRIVSQALPESRLVVYSDPHSMEADKFRTFSVHLRSHAKSSGVKTLMITSALTGEGKSVASLNLAVGLAERGSNSVILVEADVRNPVIVKRLGLEPARGLTHCLSDASDPLNSLRYVSDLGIYLLSAGDICTNPIQLLNSDRFSGLVQRLRNLADWVIFDCPPVLPVPDALAMRGSMDGCLWVVRAHKTSRTVVDEAMHMVGRELVLGIILNSVKNQGPQYHDYYNYHPLSLGPHA